MASGYFPSLRYALPIFMYAATLPGSSSVLNEPGESSLQHSFGRGILEQGIVIRMQGSPSGVCSDPFPGDNQLVHESGRASDMHPFQINFHFLVTQTRLR